MSQRQRTLEEIRSAGLRALDAALGPVDLIRFLQQFETGQGDYSAERHELLRESLDELENDWVRDRSD
jgi:hypothetical protein